MKINNTKKLYEAFRQEFRKLSCGGGLVCYTTTHNEDRAVFISGC